MQKTVILSPTGDVQLPKEFRDEDHLSSDDTFSVERLSAGQYLLQKLPARSRPKATLVRESSGRLVFDAPPGGPVLTSELIKRLEAETL